MPESGKKPRNKPAERQKPDGQAERRPDEHENAVLAVADEQGGALKNRVMMYLDEFGTIPKIESAEMMFSASRSRRVSIVAIIQSFAQPTKNY